MREAEQYNLSKSVPGRINSIVNIHNPSIEVHTVDRGINTGAAVILAAGGGHNTLNVGSEGADFVPFFYNYGVNTVILRNRLRRDGYKPQIDGVYDALQAIRIVRAYAKEWHIDPQQDRDHGLLGRGRTGRAGGGRCSTISIRPTASRRSAGGRLLAARLRGDHLSGSVAVRAQPTPADSEERAAGVCRVRRLGRPRPCDLGRSNTSRRCWQAAFPNVEMHIYGNGRHPGRGAE